MSVSEQCKSAGLQSFAEMVRITTMSDSTLRFWHKNKPHQFSCILAGAVAIKYDSVNSSKRKGGAFLKKWLLLNNISLEDQDIIANLVNRFLYD